MMSSSSKKAATITRPDTEDQFEASEFAEEDDADCVEESTEDTLSTESKDNLKPGIGAKENTAVLRSRVLVILVLLAAAAGTGLLTYFFTKASEEKEFKSDVSMRTALHLHCSA